MNEQKFGFRLVRHNLDVRFRDHYNSYSRNSRPPMHICTPWMDDVVNANAIRARSSIRHKAILGTLAAANAHSILHGRAKCRFWSESLTAY